MKCSVTKISTLIPGRDAGGRKDLLNTLITFYEQETVDLGNYGRVTYSRLNHIAFSYRISIENPGKKEKKVIVRLWMGLSTDSEDIRSENYIYIKNISKWSLKVPDEVRGVPDTNFLSQNLSDIS